MLANVSEGSTGFGVGSTKLAAGSAKLGVKETRLRGCFSQVRSGLARVGHGCDPRSGGCGQISGGLGQVWGGFDETSRVSTKHEVGWAKLSAGSIRLGVGSTNSSVSATNAGVCSAREQVGLHNIWGGFDSGELPEVWNKANSELRGHLGAPGSALDEHWCRRHTNSCEGASLRRATSKPGSGRANVGLPPVQMWERVGGEGNERGEEGEKGYPGRRLPRPAQVNSEGRLGATRV